MKNPLLLAHVERTNRIYEVVAIDWNNVTPKEVISCHLKSMDGKVEKFYPEDDYSDKIRFYESIGAKDSSGRDIYNGHILIDRNDGEKYYIKRHDEEFRYILQGLDEGHLDRVWEVHQTVLSEMRIIGHIAIQREGDK